MPACPHASCRHEYWHGFPIAICTAMNNTVKIREGGAKVAQPLAELRRFYTLHDMSKMFSVSLRCIYNWLDQQRFSFVKIGSKTYLTERQLQEFLANHQVKSFNVGRAKS